MINLKQRSYQKELMDGDDIPLDAMRQTLRELNTINTYLGGHAITLAGLKTLLNNKTSITICEIGCGGGDNLAAIYNYCRQHNIAVQFIGIDMNEACTRYAQQQYPQLPARWICSDYAGVDFNNNQPDIIFSSLFCHHFTNEQLVTMLQWLQRNSRTGFFINDLQRHWLAYYLIKYITRFFSRSYLVKNDACLSVARSFTRSDWQQLMQAAGIQAYTIGWKWAFRWLVTVETTGHGK